MSEDRPPDRWSLDDQVRALGFDPVHLTKKERVELIQIHQAVPDEQLDRAEMATPVH